MEADGSVYAGSFVNDLFHGKGNFCIKAFRKVANAVRMPVSEQHFASDLCSQDACGSIISFVVMGSQVAAIQRMQKLSGLWEGPGEDEFSEDVDSAEQLNAVVGSSFR